MFVISRAIFGGKVVMFPLNQAPEVTYITMFPMKIAMEVAYQGGRMALFSD
jgi:hypothetical protein